MANTPESIKADNRSAFVRQMIMRNPNATLEQIKDAWEKTNHPKSDMPKMHDVHVARSVIRRKYGVKDMNSIPRKANGEINVTGLLRMLLRKHPKFTMKKAQRYILPEGITFKPSLWSVMMHHDRKVQENLSKELGDSPDENQNSGPRASRKPSRNGKPSSTNKVKESSLSRLMDIETSLDQIIQKLDGTDMQELAQSLRDARRFVSKDIFAATH